MTKFDLAVQWIDDDLQRTFYQAAEKFGIESNEMCKLYAAYAEQRKDKK